MYKFYDGAREKTHSVVTLFFYGVYDRARSKTHSYKTLFFVSFLSLSKRKNSFCYHLILCIFSMNEQEKKLIFFSNYFLSVVSDGGREISHFVVRLVFVFYLWWSKMKNSFCYNVTFSLLTREKNHSVTTLFFV